MNSTAQTDASQGHLDPVCGMTVAADTPHQTEYQGNIYRFCCRRCLERFTAEPEATLEKRARAADEPAAPPSKALATALHICPMCPEVRNTGPGICPSRGMALEPDEEPRRSIC